MADIKKENAGIFAVGLVLGKYGKDIFGSDKAKDVYVRGTVWGIRAKDAIVNAKSIISENAKDIYEEAKVIKEEEDRISEEKEEEKIYDDLSDFTEEIPD